MHILLYILLACNLISGMVSLVNHDPPGVWHAVLYGLVTLGALVTAKMTRKVDR